jgi:hypothetical protein
MRTANTSKAADAVFLVLGTVLLLFLHTFALDDIPGLHFDEAWAMNHAWRLAEGQWTLEAMSPYTAPWAHYWAALWMKLFGPSLFVFRLSQVALSLGGIALLFVALWQSGRRSAAVFLPLAMALLPGLVMNHRFAIELTGFHSFCFGLFAWALVRGWPLLAVLAWVAGTTGHILFYGLGLAALGACFWEGRELKTKERLAILLGALVLSAFFFRVQLLIPEKGKAAALLASAALIIPLVLLRAERWKLWRKPLWEPIVLVGAVIFLFNGIMFAEGFWSLSLTTGKEGWKGGRAVNLALFLPLAFWLCYKGSREFPRQLRRAFLLGVICLGAMMLKPAPRYFELFFLMFGLFLAQGMANLSFLARIATGFFLLVHATVLFSEYFTITPREVSLRFLLFKDSSRDFLSKQSLVSVLGGSGCALSDIKSVDPRVGEALLALSRADWPVASQPCRWQNLHVERRAESVRTGIREEAADFVIWENP